jgi:HD-GYP domain-containing protein (c-di-GMP phosphodiesterase class II)
MHLNLPTHTLTELGTAGLLHDVGKSKIPREILFKPARLDDEERAVMSQHPRLGAQLLAAHPHAGAMSIGAAFGHHLRRDRRGYPSIGSWHPVGKATALMHVCDVFEALTAVRPYKPALTPRRAFEIMLRDSGAFHPGALAVLLRCMGLYPPGSRVLLSSGERGTVVAAGADIERPRLQLTHDVRGCALPAEAQRELDLATEIEVSVVRLLEDPIVPPSTAELSAHRC